MTRIGISALGEMFVQPARGGQSPSEAATPLTTPYSQLAVGS